MKVNEIKQKVVAKVAKGKAKVAKKCGKAKACAAWIVATAAMAAIVGCQSPAQRAQTAETKQVFNIYEGATATFTFGSEFVSLAQSNETGGNDAGLTATQTTDTKPEIAVGVGGSSAGVGSSGASKQGVGAAIGAAADAIGGMFSGSDAKDASPAPAKTDCSDGSCSDGSCEDGSCSEGGCEDGSCSE